MNTLSALKNRRSSRIFAPGRDIPGDTLIELVDCGRLAPTARNVQPWEFVVITKKDTLVKIAELASTGRFIAGCSACIAVFCSDTKYYLEDGVAATENILIAATDMGLASCWVAGDKKEYTEDIKKLLNAPAQAKLISLIALGYPAGDPKNIPPKRAINEVLHWDHFI